MSSTTFPGVEDARGLRGVVGGVNSDRHANCVGFHQGFSGMDMLCSDKTGTLTQYIITIESKLPWC